MREFFDAIIIGGGPAGALSAILLAHQGRSIAIIERRKRNRSKACGHCLSPRAFPILREAGVLELVRGVAVGTTERLRVHLPGRPPIELALNRTSQPGLLVERNTLDQALLEHAVHHGAVLFQPAKALVGHCETRSRYRAVHVVTDETEHVLFAPLIVGADGLRSGVARLFQVKTRSGGKLGFSFDVPRTQGFNAESPAIDMFVTSQGYLGVVAQENGRQHVAALVGVQDGTARNALRFCRGMALQFQELTALGLDQMTRPMGSNSRAAAPMFWKPATIAGSRFALVGDAAGYIEPFTGEGMCWSLQSAAALAEAAADAKTGGWDATCALRYEHLWRARVERSQRRCARIAWLLERPWLLETAHRLARTVPFAAERFAQRVVTT